MTTTAATSEIGTRSRMRSERIAARSILSAMHASGLAGAIRPPTLAQRRTAKEVYDQLRERRTTRRDDEFDHPLPDPVRHVPRLRRADARGGGARAAPWRRSRRPADGNPRQSRLALPGRPADQ